MNHFLLFLILISFVSVYSASSKTMPLPSIQQKAPEFTVSALMPNKVSNFFS
jgi:hypothetical protein